MALQPKERKILIITGSALIVAIVTFGVLGSSGTLHNNLYDLGGAIVGFLATAMALNRFYGVDPGEIPEGELKGRAFLSEDTVRVLDLRNQKPLQAGEQNRAHLVEHLRVKKIGDEAVLKFPYATNGFGMEGGNLSHDAPLVDKTDELPEAGEDKHLKRQYEIELDLNGVAKGETVLINNAVTYINGFEGPDKEWFHAHVNLPTKSLTIIVLFPPALRPTSIKSTEQVGKAKAREVEKEKGLPVKVEGGEMVYWRVANPLIGACYKLEWVWKNTPTAPIATGV